MFQRGEVHHRDYDLPPDAHRVELAGAPRRLVWPAICPNCGAPAADRIVVRKIFRRHGSTRGRGWTYVIRSAEIPVCAACAERHRRELRRLTPVQMALSLIRTPVMLALVPACWFAVVSLRAEAGALRRGDWSALGLPGIFAFAALWSGVMVWWSTRLSRVPPLTDVARACDISDNLGDLITGERHAYAIRDARFAEAFRQANLERVFTAADRARVERVQGWTGLLFLLLLAVAAVLVWLFA